MAIAYKFLQFGLILTVSLMSCSLLNAQSTGSFWSTTGNAGTTNINYVGTIAPQPLIFKTTETEWMRITPAGDIGINTTSPLAKLNVKNGSILFDGTNGNTPVNGSGTRMMWISAKAAFRAGAVSSTEWDNTNIGL